MQILMNTGGIATTNCYVVADENAKVAVLFDAPDNTTREVLDEVARRGWKLIGLWLTHGHFDHVADHQVVTTLFPEAKVLMHRLDEPKLQNPGSSFFELPFTIPSRNADGYVEEGQKLSIGGLEVQVLHTPGHSPGHVMFYFPDEQVLIGGDLIICGAVGRTDLPDSVQSDLEASIRRVMKLPGKTQLMPGHCASSTLEEELAHNPYVRAAIGM
jgi:glyoxylase-like metal-dependent hydrolase (beta-lactamase superfamily II)